MPEATISLCRHARALTAMRWLRARAIRDECTIGRFLCPVVLEGSQPGMTAPCMVEHRGATLCNPTEYAERSALETTKTIRKGADTPYDGKA
jgi:hypothetical protein